MPSRPLDPFQALAHSANALKIMSNTPQQQYHAITQACGFARLPNRCLFKMSGADCKKHLHSFCTADILGLSDGQCTEAFVLNEKGKLLGYVHVLCLGADLVISGHGAQSQTLIQHLDKFVIREDVKFTDMSEEWTALFIAGAKSPDLVEERFGVRNVEGRVLETENEKRWMLAAVEVAGPGYLVLLPAEDADSCVQSLESVNATLCDQSVLEALRIKSGTPWFGIDCGESNLPQELQRDDKAISFEKGCYLGQETVARIDALGRVNQLLVRLCYDADAAPQANDEYLVDDKVVCRVTSVAQDFETGGWSGLGYVRRPHHKSGTQLGEATVV